MWNLHGVCVHVTLQPVRLFCNRHCLNWQSWIYFRIFNLESGCLIGEEFKGLSPNPIKDATDAQRFRLRKPLEGGELVACCGLLQATCSGTSPHWCLIKCDHICCHSAAVDTRLRANPTELHFGVMMSRMWCHYTVCDDIMDFFLRFSSAGSLCAALCFYMNVGDDVGIWGRVSGERVCVLLF